MFDSKKKRLSIRKNNTPKSGIKIILFNRWSISEMGIDSNDTIFRYLDIPKVMTVQITKFTAAHMRNAKISSVRVTRYRYGLDHYDLSKHTKLSNSVIGG